MRTYRISDNTSVDKSALSEISVLVKRIVNKDLSKLEQEGIFIFPEIPKESEDLDNNRVVLREIVHSGKDVFKTYNIMGFLGYADEWLIITSRFSDMGEDQQADNFLQYMLKKVFDLPNSVNLFPVAIRMRCSLNSVYSFFLIT
ncbi:hypothetical protein GCM10007377_11140 [Galliscardovia ingluviei]|uniref:Uncharacterized protein n=1 Tax=Galliscardovia ingluviei TaxID=1769422 RepID=A0A8J3EZ08_9BIFI|nr:hypothetical protein [Galliscardovia ingluviei]GGI14479.1 hypothetical protein GCM10007377_11140 [Galliscardovia ingluviei]